MGRPILVRDIMSSPVESLSLRQSISVAEVVMRRNRIRHLPVTDPKGQLVGLVTARTLLRVKAGELLPVDQDAESEQELRVPVVDIMETNVWSVAADAPAVSAAKLLKDHRFGCLPVTDSGVLVGIVTEVDFLSLITQSLELGPPPAPLTAAQVMTPIPATVAPERPLAFARHRMQALNIRHLPIVSETDVPLGLVTERDLSIAEAVVGSDSKLAVGVLINGVLGTGAPHCVDLHAPLGPILIDMATARVDAVLVTHKAKLVGIFTTTDATRLLGEHLHQLTPEPPPER